jgi:hypothetical protein
VLRAAIEIIVAAFLVAALAAVAIEPAAFPVLIVAGLLALGTFFERFAYKGGRDGRFGAASTGGAWQATTERFLDQESGRVVTVWFNPANGERRYVEEGAQPPV